MDQQKVRRYVQESGPKVPHALLDYLRDKYKLPNDAALARELNSSAPVLSRIRNGEKNIGATLILAIHEKLGMPVAEIRKLSRESA